MEELRAKKVRYYVKKGVVTKPHPHDKNKMIEYKSGSVFSEGDLDDTAIAHCLKNDVIAVVPEDAISLPMASEPSAEGSSKGPSEKQTEAAREAALKEEEARKDALEENAEDDALSPAKANKWDCNPAELADTALPVLNVMIHERDPSFQEPYETTEEAIAHLSSEFTQ